MRKGQWPWSQSNGIRRAETAEEVIERLSMPLTECGCYVWLGELNDWGYPLISYKIAPKKGTTRRAQRVIYELTKGPIPDGLQIDHTCKQRWCVNPDHYEAVTPKENRARANDPSPREFCKNGHLMAETRKDRRCSICHEEAKRAANQKRTANGYWRTEEYKALKREQDRARYAANREAMAAKKKAQRHRRNAATRGIEE